MEDVITEAAPPSRFFEEDLNTFTPPSPPLPSPFLLFSHPQPLKPTFLIIDLSLFHHPDPNNNHSNSLIASLILPELPISQNTPINLYSLPNDTVFVSAHSPVSPDRAHAVARLLIGDRILPGSVLVLDSIRPRNHRGRLSSDEAVAFKLETSAERKMGKGEKLLGGGLEYYPSGSVVDGLGAAILGRCQILNVRASLFLSWPQFDDSVVSLLKGALQNGVLHGLDLSDEVFKVGRRRSKDHASLSDLYI